MSLVWVKAGACEQESTVEARRTVYRLASEHVCRHSCVVPAAVFRALEVEANIFPAAESQIVFVDSVGG